MSFFPTGFSSNFVWNVTFALLLSKTTKKTRCTLQKTVTFVKLSFFCRGFFLTFCLKSHRLPSFGKKKLNKHDVPCKKAVMFCEICRFFADGFFWNSVGNLTFFPFFVNKLKKNHVPSKKTVTFYENCRSIIKDFRFKPVENLSF